MRIAVILHLYYQDLWPEFDRYLKNIEEPFDLCVSLCNDFECASIQKKIKESYPNVRFMVNENRGADVWPFFKWIYALIDEGKEYDCILKIHTKKSIRKNVENRAWRTRCIVPIVGNRANVQRCLQHMSAPANGMVGGKSELIPDGVKYKNLLDGESYLVQLMEMFGVNTSKRSFYIGTMFWCRYDVLKKYMLKHRLSSDFFLVGHHVICGTAAHAGERFISRLFLNDNLNLVGV